MSCNLQLSKSFSSWLVCQISQLGSNMTTMKTMKTLTKKPPQKKTSPLPLPHVSSDPIRHIRPLRKAWPLGAAGATRIVGKSWGHGGHRVPAVLNLLLCRERAPNLATSHIWPQKNGFVFNIKTPQKKTVRTLGPKSINQKKVGNGNGTPGNLCTSISTAFCEDSAEPRLELCREPWRMAPVAERRRPAWMLVWEPGNHDCG